MKLPQAADFGLSQAVLDALPDAVFLLDRQDGSMHPVNAAAKAWAAGIDANASEAAVGVAQLFPELADQALDDATCAPLHANVMSDAAGARRAVKLSCYPVGSADERLLAVVVSPIEQGRLEEGAVRDALDDALHDPLTRLGNRRLFERRLRRAIERAGAGDYTFAVLFVDLDRFKGVNDRFGHLHGDQLLTSAAHRLVEAVRPQDMVARRDGDEFTVLLDDLAHVDDALSVAQRIVEHLQTPLPVATDQGALEVSIGASVGIVTASDSTASAEVLVARADAAMYQAKALGGSTCVVSRHLAEHRTGKPLPR